MITSSAKEVTKKQQQACTSGTSCGTKSSAKCGKNVWCCECEALDLRDVLIFFYVTGGSEADILT